MPSMRRAPGGGRHHREPRYTFLGREGGRGREPLFAKRGSLPRFLASLSPLKGQCMALERYAGPGCLVEFMQGNQPQVAWVLEESSGRLRLYTLTRREEKMTLSRVLPWMGPRYDGTRDRSEMLEILTAHQARREAAARAVDPLELWELARVRCARSRPSGSPAWSARLRMWTPWPPWAGRCLAARPISSSTPPDSRFFRPRWSNAVWPRPPWPRSGKRSWWPGRPFSRNCGRAGPAANAGNPPPWPPNWTRRPPGSWPTCCVASLPTPTTPRWRRCGPCCARACPSTPSRR